MSQSLSHSPSEDSNVQKYMIMSSQEEVVRRRLSLQIPSAVPMTASSPEMQSLSSSPTFSPTIYSSSWAPTLGYSSTEPIPIHPGMNNQHTHNDTNDEVNQRLKATLTELLNTESVRSDEKYRAWIQDRLMDAEKKIRRQRRRHSSNPGGEELATSIAEHIDYHITPCKTWN